MNNLFIQDIAIFNNKDAVILIIASSTTYLNIGYHWLAIQLHLCEAFNKSFFNSFAINGTKSEASLRGMPSKGSINSGFIISIISFANNEAFLPRKANAIKSRLFKYGANNNQFNTPILGSKLPCYYSNF